MEQRKLAYLLAALVACWSTACSSGDKPPPAAPEKTSPFAGLEVPWTDPLCFGYAPEAESYACLDFAFKTDATGPDEMSPLDFTTWKPTPDVGWSGHHAIELVAGERSSVKLAHKAHDATLDIERTQSMRAALVEIEDKGYGAGVVGKPLENGTWVDIQGVSLRFRSTSKIEGNSQYYLGSLQLVCADEPVSSAIELLPKQRGDFASVFAAKGATAIIASVVESGGEDGGWYFRINNVHIDLTERCGG